MTITKLILCKNLRKERIAIGQTNQHGLQPGKKARIANPPRLLAGSPAKPTDRRELVAGKSRASGQTLISNIRLPLMLQLNSAVKLLNIYNYEFPRLYSLKHNWKLIIAPTAAFINVGNLGSELFISF